MPRSHARGPSRGSHPTSLLVPFALTLTTAAIASAGLYFFGAEGYSNGSHPPYPPSDSDNDLGSFKRKPSRRRDRFGRRQGRGSMEHDRITEEDTDEIEESRREEDEYRRRRYGHGAAGMLGAAGAATSKYMKDALTSVDEENMDDDGMLYDDQGFDGGSTKAQVESHTSSKATTSKTTSKTNRRKQEAMESSRDGAPIPMPIPTYEYNAKLHEDHAKSYAELTNEKVKRSSSLPTVPSAAAAAGAAAAARTDASLSRSKTVTETSERSMPGQYVPTEKRKRSIVIVLSERKALQGHDSDGDLDEMFLPTSLLAQLPSPLKLRNATLNILIYSPHMPSRRSPPTPPAATNLGVKVPSPHPSPSLRPTRFTTPEDANKSSYELARQLFARSGLSDENIKPFTDLNKLTSLVRKLQPSVLYIEESVLSNHGSGEMVDEMLGPRGGVQMLVLVTGGDDELGGLVSSDDEAQRDRKIGRGKWWEEGGKIRERHGRRLEILESWAMEDDWRRQVVEPTNEQ